MPVEDRLQTRHTLAAIVYFIYGIYYLFGAQYLTSMQSTERAMSNPKVFFILGAIIAVAFPILIYRRTGIGVSFLQRATGRHRSYQISFTLLLGLLVCARVCRAAARRPVPEIFAAHHCAGAGGGERRVSAVGRPGAGVVARPGVGRGARRRRRGNAARGG